MATDSKTPQFDAGIGTKPSKTDRIQHARFGSRLAHLIQSARFASLLPQEHSALQVARETLLLSAVVIAACRAAVPSDPLLLTTQFPWLWLLPIFVALRYGTVGGVGSSMILLGAGVAFYGALPVSQPFPRGYFFGGLVAVLLSGQFSDTWTTRLRQARLSNDYLNERLSILTNNQFLLRLSHERLEQDLLVRPGTLRDTLTRLRDVTLQESAWPAYIAGDLSLAGAQRFLETIAQSCQIESAQVYEIREGSLSGRPVASVGLPFELDASDPLIAHALDESALAHLQSLDVRGDAPSRYIVCAPLVAAGKETVGILLVSKLPFLALTNDNLRFMFALCGYYANGTRHASITCDLLIDFPDCPYDFALEYSRLVHLERQSGVESSVVALLFDAGRQAQALLDYIVLANREHHLQWTLRGDGAWALIFLMPLSGDVAVESRLQQIESDVRAQFGIDFARARVAAHWAHLSGGAPADPLKQLMANCDGAT